VWLENGYEKEYGMDSNVAYIIAITANPSSQFVALSPSEGGGGLAVFCSYDQVVDCGGCSAPRAIDPSALVCSLYLCRAIRAAGGMTGAARGRLGWPGQSGSHSTAAHARLSMRSFGCCCLLLVVLLVLVGIWARLMVELYSCVVDG
jgi:hypothetical protein